MTAGAPPLTQIPFEFGLQLSYAAADFLVADSNAEAFSWIERWPDWPAPGLAVYGPAGCGKSHLATLWCVRAGAVLIPAATLEQQDAAELLGEASCCAIDGLIDRVGGGVAERVALHLYNMSAERRGQLMLCAAEPPARWRIELPDLRSRLVALPSVAIGPPDDALLRALVAKLFSDRQVTVEQEVVNYIVARMERSFDGARRVVDAIDRAALTQQRRATGPLVRSVLDVIGRDSAGD